MNNGQFWTEAETQALKDLRAAGNSFAVIARFLKRTRNACIGHANRLRLNAPDRLITKEEHFSDVLAETGSIQQAGRAIGYDLDKSMSRFRKVCKELGWQAQ